MKNSTPVFFMLCCAVTVVLNSHAQTQPWSERIASLGQLHGTSIVQCTDGGFAVGGRLGQQISMTRTRTLMFAAKVDTFGNLLWTRYFGSGYTSTTGVLTLSKDGGYALAGYTNQYGGGKEDFYMVKLDASGNFQWAKTIGGTKSEYGNGIVSTSDGGYVMIGSTASYGVGSPDNVYVVKLDSLGNLLWTKTLGGTGDDFGSSIIQTKDGGYALTGITNSFGAGMKDAYVVKLDSAGNIMWTKTIGGPKNDFGNAIIQSRDGGYAIAGSTSSFQDTVNGSGYIIKLDSSGNIQWNIVIGNSTYASSIIQVSNGDFVIAGSSNGYACFIRTDTLGNVKDTISYGTGTSTSADAIIHTKSGGYAMAGTNVTTAFHMNSDFLSILVLDSAGSNCETVINPMPVSHGGLTSSGGSVIVSDSGVVGSGDTSQTGGSVTMLCSLLTSTVNEKSSDSQIDVYPNPTSGVVTLAIPDLPQASRNGFGTGSKGALSIEVFDIFGQLIYSQSNNLSRSNFGIQNLTSNIDLSNQPNGVYFYRVTNEKGELACKGKLIIER